TAKKAAKKTAKKAAQKTVKKTAQKRASKASAKPSSKTVKSAAVKSVAVKSVAAQAPSLDLSGLPAGSLTRYASVLCLACVFDLFTKQLGLAPRTAAAEVRRYAATVEELTAKEPARPFFKPTAERHARCPYCDAAKSWHARLDTYRVEGGKATDAARRALLKSLSFKDEQFQVHETKSTARAVFFEWLDALGRTLDFEDERAWMLEAARAYLERREPKTVWREIFDGVRQVRRSQRLEEGFERDGARLFLAPTLYNDVLLVQYLVSRSHAHGGRTFEGRLTLLDLVRRMRHSGHLEAHGMSSERDQFVVLEQLVEQLTGGEASVKLHYVVDRRDLLDKVKTISARYTA
ncbi:MAG TPA: hypothetical protein VF754_00740, partial [Pyrinomonadaceae bacterium]